MGYLFFSFFFFFFSFLHFPHHFDSLDSAFIFIICFDRTDNASATVLTIILEYRKSLYDCKTIAWVFPYSLASSVTCLARPHPCPTSLFFLLCHVFSGVFDPLHRGGDRLQLEITVKAQLLVVVRELSSSLFMCYVHKLPCEALSSISNVLLLKASKHSQGCASLQ